MGTDTEPTALASSAFPWPLQLSAAKRAGDVTLALAALVLAAPVMLACAAAVKLTSPGPVLYHGPRMGLGGLPFRQLKFRTMTVGADRQGAFTGRDDRRVTRIGRLLRWTKLDELPQFVNVLRGEMSVVGPRPEDETVVRRLYTRDQLRVLSVRPGLTCLVQVRHFPDFSIPSDVDPNAYYQAVVLPARLQEDLEYVDRQSALLDAGIILQTMYCVGVKSWFILGRRALGV